MMVPQPPHPGGGFLGWLEEWVAGLPKVPLDQVLEGPGGPAATAVMIVDLLVGFCCEGPLASARVGALAARSAAFLTAVREAGVTQFLLNTDSHPPDSPEFAAFPPHCVNGTREAEVIPEIQALPFYAEMSRVRKGSLAVGQEPGFARWQSEHPEVRRWIILGDCTDLCVYQAAMHLRCEANRTGASVEIWLPADLVETYDLSVETAAAAGALPHDGELLHRVFLYHMALNGIRVVGSLVT